jgi:rhamnosyl/mannosyltransferase
MKVTHICKAYPPETIGGMEWVVKTVVEGIAALGTNVEVICLSDSFGTRTESINGQKIYFFRTNFRFAGTPISASAALQVRRLIENSDVVHYHFPYPFLDFIHFFSGIIQPSVVTYHSDIVRQKHLLRIYKPLMHRFLSSVTRIVATSPHYLETSELLSKYRNKTSIIPIGLERLQYPAASEKRIAYWKRRTEKKFFLFVGVLRYYKGLVVLLKAAKSSKYPVVIVGDGPLEKKLKGIVANERIRNVTFTGRISEEDKVALFFLSHAVILPSTVRAEAFGLSLLEGAMFGKPLISTEIGTGTSFINKDKKTGIVVPPDDPKALKSAMEFLWGHPHEAAAMGSQAKERYLNKFTAEKMTRSYIDLYGEITNRI